MPRPNGDRADGEGNQRVSRIEILNSQLEGFIAFQQSKRRWNNAAICVRAAVAALCFHWLLGDRGWGQLVDVVLLTLYVVWTYFGFREDRKIVACIKQAEIQKAEWEEKKKAFRVE